MKIKSPPEIENLTELKLERLKGLCLEYDIQTSGNKEELIQRIMDYESGKLIKPVQYDTINKQHFIGIYINDKHNMMEINKYFQRGEARFHHYETDYYFYITKDKIKLNNKIIS